VRFDIGQLTSEDSELFGELVSVLIDLASASLANALKTFEVSRLGGSAMNASHAPEFSSKRPLLEFSVVFLVFRGVLDESLAELILRFAISPARSLSYPRFSSGSSDSQIRRGFARGLSLVWSLHLEPLC